MAIKIADLWMTFALSTGLIFFGQSIVLASNQQQSNLGQVLPISATTEIAGQTFDLEVAQTPEQQAIGLMNRTFLPDNRGMLFPLDSTQLAGFWMRDTPIPLDIIFLLNGTVLEVLVRALLIWALTTYFFFSQNPWALNLRLRCLKTFIY